MTPSLDALTDVLGRLIESVPPGRANQSALARRSVGLGAAVIAVLAALGLKGLWFGSLGDDSPALLMMGTILVVAVGFGGLAGTAAAFLGLAGDMAFFPIGDDRSLRLELVAFVLAFLLEAALIVLLAVAIRRALGALKAETRRQGVLASLARQAVSESNELAMFRAVVEAATTELDVDAAFVAEDAEGEPRVLAAAGVVAAPAALETNEVLDLLERGASQPRVTVVGPAADGPLPFLAENGWRTAMVARAAMAEPARLGVIAGRRSGQDWSASERRFLSAVAGVAGTFAERQKGKRALEQSEQRLRLAQTAASIGTWEWTPAGDVMVWSDELRVLHGIEGDPPPGSAAYVAMVHDEDRERVLAEVATARQTGSLDSQYRVVRPDGSVRWVWSRGHVFPGDNGAPDAKLVGVSTDITEKRAVEETIRQSAERFRVMANAAPVLLRVKGPDGGAVFVNDRWTALTGRPVEDHLGFGWLDFVHPDDLSECRARLAEAVSSEGPVEFEYRVRTADGDYRWMLDRSSPVRESDGRLLAFVGACTDITDRREAEDALRVAADAGTELGESLDYEETLRQFSEFTVERFADCCIVLLKSGQGFHRVSAVHKDPKKAQVMEELLRLEDLEVDGESVIPRSLRSGEAALFPEVTPDRLVHETAEPARRAALEKLDIRSAIIAPMTADRETIGGIVFLRGTATRRFSQADLTLARDLARRASAAIDNSRLYSDLLDRESALERANFMLTFLLDASAELSRTLDLDEMLQRLASLATPRVADWCTIMTLGENRRPKLLAAAHRDAQALQQVEELTRRYPFNPSANAPIMRAMEGGRPAFFPHLSDALIAASASSPDHLELLRALGLSSAIVVPLTGTFQTYGAMTFVMAGSGRTYTEEDFASLQDLAHRAALAFDNASLYRQTQDRELELRRANDAKDEFLGMMSHELRTPLTIINGGARVLRARSAELDAESRDSILNDIESESDRLFRMVENLLSLAHLQFAEGFEVEPVQVARLTEKVVAAFRARRPERTVSLEVEAGAETFAAQPVYLEQVVRNLLSNADKYSPKGAAIEISLRRAGEGVGELVVRDRGVGIDPEEAELIFERFYRSERTSRLVGGSGVGLALCKRLIEAMSGQIWARPREGGGLEVGFSLPLYEEAFV